MFFDLVKRSILVALADNESAGVKSFFSDAFGALWTRDAQAQPAQLSTAIAANATALAVQNPPITFRALRFGSPIAGTTGTVTVTYAKADGTAGDAGIVEGVTAGEVWSTSSASIYAITAISGVTVRGLG